MKVTVNHWSTGTNTEPFEIINRAGKDQYFTRQDRIDSCSVYDQNFFTVGHYPHHDCLNEKKVIVSDVHFHC